jgi:predicted ATP-grasp superfamily ATP-dependent carboligase
MSIRQTSMSPVAGRQASTGAKAMAHAHTGLPPAVLLGGGCNALCIARSLGRAGVRVYALNTSDAIVFRSRYCTPLRGWGEDVTGWGSYLLSSASDGLRGAVVLACSDAEAEYLIHHREELAARYVLDLESAAGQKAMLNKLQTYRIAQAAGVPLPHFWTPQTRAEIEELRPILGYPVLVKPLQAHVYRRKFTKRLVIAHDFEQVIKASDTARLAGIDVMLVEMIPGPDDRLCSYYTYIDENGTPLFDFTKRIIRRSPPLLGGGSCHITDWNPEVKELALRLFRAAGLRGLANAEFKRDERDGRLKLIECNIRFTEGTPLLVGSGVDEPLFVYNRLTGRPLPPMSSYRTGLRLWYPVEDFHAFRILRRRGELTWRQWWASIARPRMLPYFQWTDPWPSLVEGSRLFTAVGRRLRSLGRAVLRLARPSPASGGF